MSKEKRQCEGKVSRPGDWGYSPCHSSGTIEFSGKWYCHRHHPPTVKARAIAESDRQQAEYKARRDTQAKADRERSLAAKALGWMRTENPVVVAEWEREMEKKV